MYKYPILHSGNRVTLPKYRIITFAYDENIDDTYVKSDVNNNHYDVNKLFIMYWYWVNFDRTALDDIDWDVFLDDKENDELKMRYYKTFNLFNELCFPDNPIKHTDCARKRFVEEYVDGNYLGCPHKAVYVYSDDELEKIRQNYMPDEMDYPLPERKTHQVPEHSLEIPEKEVDKVKMKYKIFECDISNDVWVENYSFGNYDEFYEALALGETEYLRKVNFDAQQEIEKLEETTEQLEETITDLQLAIVELYEGI